MVHITTKLPECPHKREFLQLKHPKSIKTEIEEALALLSQEPVQFIGEAIEIAKNKYHVVPPAGCETQKIGDIGESDTIIIIGDSEVVYFVT